MDSPGELLPHWRWDDEFPAGLPIWGPRTFRIRGGSAVYAFIHREDASVWYVGRTSNLPNRLLEHRRAGLVSSIQRVMFWKTYSDSATARLETSLIRWLQPEGNTSRPACSDPERLYSRRVMTAVAHGEGEGSLLAWGFLNRLAPCTHCGRLQVALHGLAFRLEDSSECMACVWHHEWWDRNDAAWWATLAISSLYESFTAVRGPEEVPVVWDADPEEEWAGPAIRLLQAVPSPESA